MPPKKKVDKKDDGKEAESGPDPAREQEKEIVTSELEIQGLTAKLARWQSRGKVLAEENLALVAQLEEARRVMDETNNPLSRQLRSTHAGTLAKESELLRAGEELERILSEGAELERREAEVDGHPPLLLLGPAVRVDPGEGVDEGGLAVVDVTGRPDDDGLDIQGEREVAGQDGIARARPA